jgi:hypothetical protein
MSPQQIEELFHEAIDLERSKRDKFIEEACAGDDPALREIVSLVKHYEEANILSRPVLDALAR